MKSARFLNDFKASVFLDADIGNFQDDYFASGDWNNLMDWNFSIYSPPSNGQFTISFETDFSNAEIEIYDVSGRVALERMSVKSEQATIELNQPSGLYIVHLTIDGQKNIRRIVLE